MNDCLFCKIAGKTIPAKIVFEDKDAMAFHDLHPKARVHLLIIPKRHIDSVVTMEESDRHTMGHLLYAAKQIGLNLKLEGYQLKFHVGKKGGQEVFHVHLHLLGD